MIPGESVGALVGNLQDAVGRVPFTSGESFPGSVRGVVSVGWIGRGREERLGQCDRYKVSRGLKTYHKVDNGLFFRKRRE